jgi:predicted acetyltransferase
MTDERVLDIRPVRPDELRAAQALFRASLHHAPVPDDIWARSDGVVDPKRVLGAFSGDLLVGTARSSASALAVPGGALLPMAMVTGVGVRADHTRRGVLTSLMRAQLTGLGEPFATLRATEAVIYGRFGYGVATRGRSVVVDRRRAVFHPGVPDSGSVRVLPLADALSVLPSVYDRIGARRPGWLARPEGWWRSTGLLFEELRKLGVVALHTGSDGVDGFALYTVERDNGSRVMHVDQLHADGPGTWAALWRFLLSVDLVAEVRAELRPLDEPLESLFTDRRAVRTSSVDDETWLRVVDVPTALAARAFPEDAGSTVIEVRDDVLPVNSGRYRLGDGPACQVAEPADLTLDVAALGALYLGDVAPSALAATGRLTVVRAEALGVADRLFAVPGSPWCGTFF